MARQTFRLNLGSAEFPFLSSLYGRSIVFPQQDMHYVRPNAFTGSEADKNIGIPQMIFCENVMPFSAGYQSVGFLTSIQGTANNDFDQAFYLRDASEARTLFVPAVSGTTASRRTYDVVTNTWNSSAITVPAGARCTVSNLKSRTFVKWEFDDQFFEWNGAWAAIAFTGLVPANIKGICMANQYQIAYDYTTIYWSSTADVVDFVPSLATGAGSQKVLSNKGRIVVVLPVEDGFVIHTTSNAILAKYSGNIRFPWTFKEIKNSGGIQDQEHASAEGEGIYSYVWSTNGMMVYGPSKADPYFPVLSEFLSCRKMEVYNYTTRTITLNELSAPVNVKVEFVSNRWLVISYGVTAPTFTHAIIYDSALKRWGKVAVNHVDAFEFAGNPGSPGAVAALKWSQLQGTWAQQNNTWAEYGAVISGGVGSIIVPYRSLGFLGQDGSVKIVDFSFTSANDNAVMYLGRIQFLRDRLWEIHEVDVEQMGVESQTKMAVLPSMDGLNFDREIYPFKMTSAGKLQSWRMCEVGVNHTLRFEGNFEMVSVIARGLNHGQR